MNWNKEEWEDYAQRMANIGWEELKWINYAKENLGGKNPVLADIGANLGDYTFEFLKIMPDAECYLFEPIPEVYENLVSRFGTENPKIHYFNYGLYNETGKKEFYYLLEDKNCGMSSIHYRAGVFSSYKNEKILVNLFRLDDIFDTLKPIDFLKIDTEGSELMVLEGAKKMFEIQPPKFVQWEYGDCYKDSGVSGKDVIKFFSDRGYKSYNKYDDIEKTVDNFQEGYGGMNYFSVKL